MEDLIKKYKLNQSTWTHKGFHGVLHTPFPVGQQGIAMKDFFGDGSSVTIFFVIDNYIYWYWNDNDLTRLRELFFSRFKKDKNYLKKLKADWKKYLSKFDNLASKISPDSLAKLSNNGLVKKYNDFYQNYVREYSYFMNLGDAISMHADRYLVPEFQKVLGNDFGEVFPQLATTQYKSFLEEENEAREKLIVLYIARKEVPLNLLKKHAEKYFFIDNNYAKGEFLTADDFRKRIIVDSEKKINENKQNIKIKNNKKALISKYHLNSWQKNYYI